MATKIVTKNSSTASAVPTASDLVQGELAVNVADKRLFTEDNAGAIVELGTNPSGNVTFQDNGKAIFGAGSDLQIYHDGTSNDSIIDEAGTGNLNLQGTNVVIKTSGGSATQAEFFAGDANRFYYNNALKLATTSTGIDVTGTATMDNATFNSSAASFVTFPYNGFNYIDTTGAGAALVFRVGSTPTNALRLSSNNDISFYEDTGTTPKLFWDASAESLGIGTSSPADNLDISLNNNTGAVVGVQIHNTNAGTTSNFAGIITTAVNGTVGMRVQAASVAGLSAATFGSTTSHPARFVTADVERLRIDASGNVGIGTSSPAVKLDVQSSSSGVVARISGPNAYDAESGLQFSVGRAKISGFLNNSGGTPGTSLRFYTMPDSGSVTEAMRIDSSGNLLVGATSFPNYGTLNSYSNSGAPAGRFLGGASMPDGSAAAAFDKNSATTTTSQVFVVFTTNNQSVGSGQINANGASQAAFGSFSDARLKQNIVDLDSQWENIKALRPVEFDYIESEGGGHQIGFIAQEIEPVYPDLVGERADGMFTLSGMGKNESRLIKALQEAITRIETLEARVTELENN